MNRERTAVKTIYFSIAGSVVLAIIKWTVGVLGNSYALIADAIESTTDVVSSVLVLFGIKYSNKPADENHPYGHGRAEPLITLLVAGFLVVSASIIIYHGVKNIGMPHSLPKAWTLIFLAIIIIWKEISYRLVLKKSQETGSLSLRADAWHHRSDAITSLAAFIGISIAVILGKGYESADDWAALFAAGFILYNSYLIFRPALGEIMDEHSYEDFEVEICKVASSVNGVINTEKCFIRKMGMQYYVDLHVTMDANMTIRQGHDLSHKLKKILLEEINSLGDVLIHVEPN